MGCDNTKTKVDINELNTSSKLLSPMKFGPFSLRNHIMMCALTRVRSNKEGIVLDHHIEYYTDRAEDAGIVLTECMAVSQHGEGFPGALQAYNEKHLEGLKTLTSEVHKRNGVIFAQLYHCGRSTNAENTGGLKPISSSATLNRGHEMFEEPEEVNNEGIEAVIEQFVKSFILCKEAGFDGVEIHGANGYILDQFIRDGCNQRTDEFGGSAENRCRLALRVVDEAIKIWGADRVGMKLSPGGRYNDMIDSNPQETYKYLLGELNKRNILFVEMMRPPDQVGSGHQYETTGDQQWPELVDFIGIKEQLSNVILVGNQAITMDLAEKFITAKTVDMVSFGSMYMSNPDLAKRFKNGWKIEDPDWQRAFGGGKEGYSDFPKYVDQIEK
jgi:2,4-dienoyl-CoA reductase-like NADH-dependent reductase (Old Yellow Enzyme family)